MIEVHTKLAVLDAELSRAVYTSTKCRYPLVDFFQLAAQKSSSSKYSDAIHKSLWY